MCVQCQVLAGGQDSLYKGQALGPELTVLFVAAGCLVVASYISSSAQRSRFLVSLRVQLISGRRYFIDEQIYIAKNCLVCSTNSLQDL